ncbi:hypothetical protein FF38_08281, partial [Lucilia cuprina]
MPGRLEFETEAENDAETVIKNMLFEPEDSELDVEQKITALAVYNSRLERRTERKRTILEHNLLDYRKLAAIEKKKSKEERELLAKLKPYVRLLPREEFAKFTEDMTAEIQYRHRIAELQEYRQNGIKTLEEANKYEKEKHIRLNALFRSSQPLGRCQHLCTGDILVNPAFRRIGVGKVLGQKYLTRAHFFGYKYSIFDLVFESNTASIKLCDSLGCDRIGKVPGAGMLLNCLTPVPAIVFGKSLGSTATNENEIPLR